MSVHPTMPELERFVKGEMSDDSRRKAISQHLLSCEFCRELAKRTELFVLAEANITPVDDQSIVEALCQRSYDDYVKGIEFELHPLIVGGIPGIRSLAADGVERHRPGLEVLATLFSDSPEVVLRVMRDTDKQQEYVQLVSDDPELPKSALIATTNPDKRFILDENGRAELRFRDWEGLMSASWHVQMPELSWELEPLRYDMDAVESETPLVIDNHKGDVIEIIYQKLAVGSKVVIRVTSLDGERDFTSAHLVISTESGVAAQSVEPSSTAEFVIASESRLNIRLYK